MLLCVKDYDKREKPGFIACAIIVSSCFLLETSDSIGLIRFSPFLFPVMWLNTSLIYCIHVWIRGWLGDRL